MKSARFDKFLPMILKHEGGYVNHPADPGGATNKGITQRVYDAYRKQKSLAVQSVAGIQDEEVSDIYHAQYFIPMDGDAHKSDAYAYCLIDLAINSGVAKAKTFHVSAQGDVMKLLGMREEFYQRLVKAKPSLSVFLKGWLNRLDGIAKDFKIRWKAKR